MYANCMSHRFCCPFHLANCSKSGSLILGKQDGHINKDEGKLALSSTKKGFTYPSPLPSPPQLIYFHQLYRSLCTDVTPP